MARRSGEAPVTVFESDVVVKKPLKKAGAKSVELIELLEVSYS